MIDKKELKKIYEKNMVTEEYIIDNKLEDDFSLTVNKVAEILAFSAENVQSYVLPYLMKCRTGDYIKDYMKNRRLKIVISKESLVEYISKSLEIEEVRKVIPFEKGDIRLQDVINTIKDKRVMPTYFKYISELISAKFEESNADKERKKRRRQKAYEGYVDILDVLAAGTSDITLIQQYYKEQEELEKKELSEFNIFNVYKDDMYSIREIKEMMGYRHTQQVYRFLDRAASVKLKINDMLVSPDTTTKGDRNIRYIITKEDLEVAKADCYRILLTDAVYKALEAQCEIIDIDIKDYIIEMLLFNAKEYAKTLEKNKDK
ncbi:hypothetical protein ACSW9U_16525 (plasmid) [Clostridium perfringens]